MLRLGILIAGLVLLAIGVVGVLSGIPLHAVAVFGAVLGIAVLGERVVYKPASKDLPGPGWQRTDERFIDPATDQAMTVYFNPETGERRYVKQ